MATKVPEKEALDRVVNAMNRIIRPKPKEGGREGGKGK